MQKFYFIYLVDAMDQSELLLKCVKLPTIMSGAESVECYLRGNELAVHIEIKSNFPDGLEDNLKNIVGLYLKGLDIGEDLKIMTCQRSKSMR